MVGKLDKEIIEKFKEFQKSEAGKQYKDLEIETIKFKDNTFDKIISEFIKGSTPKYSTEKTDTIVIKSGQARGNYNEFNFNKIAYLDIGKVKNPKYLKQGDILINTTGVGTAGRVTLFDLDDKYVSDSHITALRYDLKKFNKFYLLYFFINYGFKKLESMAEGTGGQVELSMNLVKNITIPIPEDLDERFYTSLKIQEMIVEFFEYNFEKIDCIKKNIKKRHDIFERLQKALIPSTFIKDYVKIAFGRYAKEKGIEFDIMDVEFYEDKVNNIINSKGGSGAYNKNYINNNRGEYPLYTGSKEIVAYVKPLHENDIVDSESVSFNKDNDAGSKAFYHTKPYVVGGHHYSLTIKNEYSNKIMTKYFYYCMVNIFSRNKFYQSRKPVANIGVIKDFTILIPKDLENYTSLEIQKIIADFIKYTENRLQKEFDGMDKCFNNLKSQHKTYLARTFSLIDWGEQ